MIVMRMRQITTSRPCSNKLYLCDPDNSLLEVRLRQFRGTVYNLQMAGGSKTISLAWFNLL